MRNNENAFGTKKIKGPKQDNQTKVQSHIQHQPVDRNFQRGITETCNATRALRGARCYYSRESRVFGAKSCNLAISRHFI
jgi:hypothetical protein